MNLLSNNPLKVFSLWLPADNKINLTFKNVIEIFKCLSQKRLRYFYLSIRPTIVKSVSENELNHLQENFTLFLKNSKLYCLSLRLEFKNNNEKNDILKSFNYIEHYIKDDKKEVEKMERFRVRIGNHKGYLF